MMSSSSNCELDETFPSIVTWCYGAIYLVCVIIVGIKAYIRVEGAKQEAIAALSINTTLPKQPSTEHTANDNGMKEENGSHAVDTYAAFNSYTTKFARNIQNSDDGQYSVSNTLFLRLWFEDAWKKRTYC